MYSCNYSYEYIIFEYGKNSTTIKIKFNKPYFSWTTTAQWS